MNFRLASGSIVLSLLLAGCQNSDLSGWEGDFDGVIIQKAQDGSIGKKQVTGTGVFNDDAGTFELTTVAGNVTLSYGRRNRIQLESTLGDLDGATLSVDDDGCYVGGTGRGNSLAVCPDLDAHSVSIEENDNNGTAVFSAQLTLGHHLKPVSPSTFTIDDVVRLAKTQSYASRIDYEVLLQSRLQSKQAHLDLIPHLSVNAVVGLLAPINIPNLLTGLSDLVPFLFPSRWARARQAADLAKAQADASALIKIDTVSQLEELAILEWSNQRQANLIDQLSAKLDLSIEQIQVLEKFGSIPTGTSEGLKIASISMKKDLLGYQETQKSSVRNLNASLGFDSLDVIQQVNLDPILLNFSALPVYDVAATEKVMLAKSKNLTQLDSLIAAAGQEKKGAAWSWLDPSVGLGAGMFSATSIAKSKIRELQLRRAATVTQLKTQLRDLIGQWEMAKQTYKLCFQDLDQQKRRLEKVQVAYKFGRDVTAMDLVTAVQETNRSQLAIVNVETALQLLDSRIRKLTLGKNYEDL